MMRRIPLLGLVVLALFALPGCLPFAIFGADYNITVKNHTSDTIRVSTDGDLLGDAGTFDRNARTVGSGERTLLIISGFETNPTVRVEFHGQVHIYHVHANLLFGYELIEVEPSDFLTGNG